MTTYVTRPRNFSFSVWGESHPTMTVMVPDAAPCPTGLFDQFGDQIYRKKDSVAVGFRGSTKTSNPAD